MELNFTFFSTLVLFGALQGLIFGIILLFNRKHPGALFLAIFMFVLAYNGLETFNWSSHLDRHIIFFDMYPFILIFALGPSIYLYTVSLLYPEKKLSRRQVFMHYIFVAFQFVYRNIFVTLYFLVAGGIISNKAIVQWLYSIYHIYSEPLSVVVFLGYLMASIHTFRKAGVTHRIRSVSREGQQVIFKWLRALLICMVILGFAWLLTVLAPYFFDLAYDTHYYPIEIALVFFIYWIAFAGYHRTKTIYRRQPAISPKGAMNTDVDRCLSQLRNTMETDKLYLDPELSVSKVATCTGISAKTISAVLNQHANRSFNDFINDYRVREVKEKLLSPTYKHFTISGIALECGFNSQATFQRAFKSSTGKSPREYLALQLEKTGS